MRILSHTDEAEDALQEAFMEAFTKIKDFSQETSFGSWLKQIVFHKSINILRKRKMVFEEIEDCDVESIEEHNWEDDEELNFKIEEVKKGIALLREGYLLHLKKKKNTRRVKIIKVIMERSQMEMLLLKVRMAL